MFVRPQQRSVAIVDQAVTIRTEDRHVAGGRDQFVLQSTGIDVARIGFAKAGGEADRPARSKLGEFADDADCSPAIDADECRVRRSRQIGNRAKSRQFLYSVLVGVHRPDPARISHPPRLANDRCRPSSAKHRD